MRKKIIIFSIACILILTLGIFLYNQLKVKNIILDIDYTESSYFSNVMSPGQDDVIFITRDSKIKLTKKIREKKLFNKLVKCKSNNDNIVSVNKDDTLYIRNIGDVEIYCESLLGTRSNSISFLVVEGGE